MTRPSPTASTLVPCIRYRDAPKAIDWLCDAFGFERHLVVPGEDGAIAHAQLSFGSGMLMLGSAGGHDGGYDALVQTAAEAGGRGTQSIYAVVEDPDAHAARSRRAGAEIVLEPGDKEYGGRDYCCKDLEGNLWTFGSYDPWA